MTKDEIFEQVKTSLVEMFDLPEERIVPSATLREELDLDSIDAVDMAVHLQKMTGKRVELTRLKEIRTVEDVVLLVQSHLEGGAEADSLSGADAGSLPGSGVEASSEALSEARSQAEAS